METLERGLCNLNPNTFGMNLISKIIGSGVTAIGTVTERFGNIMQEQIAISIANGRPFLNCFNALQSEVLILRKGCADYDQTKDRIRVKDKRMIHIDRTRGYIYQKSENVEGTSSNGTQGGLIKYLMGMKEKHPGIGLMILGQFSDIQIRFSEYIKNLMSAENINPQAAFRLMFERDRDDIQSLRDFSAEQNVSILIGSALTATGKFSTQVSHASRFCENCMYLIEGKDDSWTLKVKGEYVPTASYELIYNHHNGFQLAEKEFMRMQDIILTKNERKIIDAMWGKGPMRKIDIESASGVSHSTVAQRLKALQTEQKGCWVVPCSDKHYIVDSTKERPWNVQEQ